VPPPPVGLAKPSPPWPWWIEPPSAEFFRFVVFVGLAGVVGVDVGVELLEEEGGLFANPVVLEGGVVVLTFGAVVFAGALVTFFVAFFLARPETKLWVPGLLARKLIVFDLPTVVVLDPVLRLLAERVGAGERDRRSGASAR
jgi:hypothetical protein